MLGQTWQTKNLTQWCWINRNEKVNIMNCGTLAPLYVHVQCMVLKLDPVTVFLHHIPWTYVLDDAITQCYHLSARVSLSFGQYCYNSSPRSYLSSTSEHVLQKNNVLLKNWLSVGYTSKMLINDHVIWKFSR